MPAEMQVGQELVSIVVPARNEEQFIGACMDSILSQTYKDLEVIVVDGASTDNTASIVRSYAAKDRRVRLVDNPRAVTPTSLNRGVAEASGRWLVRIDGHATVSETYVERAINHLRTGRWAGVGGQVDAVGKTAAGRAVAVAMGSRFGIGNSVHHYGTTLTAADHVPFPAYETQLVREMGGWNEDLPVNQDYELDYRIVSSGKHLLYDPEMRIRYHCRQSIPGVFRQFRRYGRGKARVIRLHPDSVRVRHLVAPGLVIAWTGAAFLVKSRPRLAAAVTLPYVAGLAVSACSSGRQLSSWSDRTRLPLAFVAMHWAWGIGFWEGALREACAARAR